MFSKKKIIGIVILLAALAAAAGVGLFLSRDYQHPSPAAALVETVTEAEAAHALSDANAAAAQQAIDIVDKYLSYSSLDDLTYGSESATDDLREIADSLTDEGDEGSQILRELLEGYIDRIIVELDLNEKNISNGLRILEGGETADREVIQAYRDKIEDLIS